MPTKEDAQLYMNLLARCLKIVDEFPGAFNEINSILHYSEVADEIFNLMNTLWEQGIQTFLFHVLHLLNEIENQEDVSVKFIKAFEICKWLLGVLFSVEGLKKSRYKLITKYQNSGSTECFTSDYPKVILKTKWFEKKMRYQFEASGFYGFEAYDDFLTALYGDYLIIPPPEKRISHSYYEIDYGPY